MFCWIFTVWACVSYQSYFFNHGAVLFMAWTNIQVKILKVSESKYLTRWWGIGMMWVFPEVPNSSADIGIWLICECILLCMYEQRHAWCQSQLCFPVNTWLFNLHDAWIKQKQWDIHHLVWDPIKLLLK